MRFGVLERKIIRYCPNICLSAKNFVLIKEAWEIEDAYMFGPDLLVAPVMEEGLCSGTACDYSGYDKRRKRIRNL